MCGICGIYYPDNHPDSKKIDTMNNRLQHRGPDDCGLITIDNNSDSHFGLGLFPSVALACLLR